MRRFFPFRLCLLAVFLSPSPSSIPRLSAEHYIEWAKQEPAVADKVSALRRCLREFPQDPLANTARVHLIALLSGQNRYQEALRLYEENLSLRMPTGEPDLKYLDLLLQTGRHADVLRLTAQAPNNGREVPFDTHLFEIRIQAFLAQGKYREARETADQWLGMHGRHGEDHSRFSFDVRNFQLLRRYIWKLERLQGERGKPLFTASVSDSLIRWSRRRKVPVIFYKLVPADPEHQADVQPLESEKTAFKTLVADMNRGFAYLSGGAFSLKFTDVHTLYAQQDDSDLSEPKTNLLVSRIYAHTLPPPYGSTGRAFVVLVDYRARPDDETAYVGDGLIHITATNLHSLTLMHEILHGLGATHQEWSLMKSLGYRFDSKDQGLMTFDKEGLRYLGLEEKNRVLLDWPYVVPLNFPNQQTDVKTILSPAYANLPLIP